MRTSVGCVLAAAAGLLPLPTVGRQFSLPVERRSSPLPLQRRDTGDADVGTIYAGTDWVTSINIGGQDVVVQIDTGSADLWVASTLLPASYIKANLSQNHIFNPSKSPTWHKTNLIFNISYNTGELGASGVIGTETIDIGGANTTDFPIGAASNMFGNGIIDSTYDGTFGLGWSAQSSYETTSGTSEPGPTFFQFVQKDLDIPVFFCDFKHEHSESIGFGFINTTLFNGPLQNMTVNNSSGFWSVDNVTFTSNGNSLSHPAGINVLFDTGGVGTTTDPYTAQNYWKLVQGSRKDPQNGFIFPCNTKTLPDLTLQLGIGGPSATVSGSLINGSASGVSDNAKMCVGGLQATANDHANAGFGFFLNYFTVWDAINLNIGFAPYSNVDDTAGTDPQHLDTYSATGTMPHPSVPPGVSSTTNSGGAIVTSAGNGSGSLISSGVVGPTSPVSGPSAGPGSSSSKAAAARATALPLSFGLARSPEWVQSGLWQTGSRVGYGIWNLGIITGMLATLAGLVML